MVDRRLCVERRRTRRNGGDGRGDAPAAGGAGSRAVGRTGFLRGRSARSPALHAAGRDRRAAGAGGAAAGQSRGHPPLAIEAGLGSHLAGAARFIAGACTHTRATGPARLFLALSWGVTAANTKKTKTTTKKRYSVMSNIFELLEAEQM